MHLRYLSPRDLPLFCQHPPCPRHQTIRRSRTPGRKCLPALMMISDADSDYHLRFEDRKTWFARPDSVVSRIGIVYLNHRALGNSTSAEPHKVTWHETLTKKLTPYPNLSLGRKGGNQRIANIGILARMSEIHWKYWYREDTDMNGRRRM